MLLKPFNSVEPDIARAGVGESYASTLVASVQEPLAQTVNATGVNAFQYLMRHGQTAHQAACRQVCAGQGTFSMQ